MQLAELRFAEGSPRAAADELQHHILALEFREAVALSLRVLELEVWGAVPYFGHGRHFRPLRRETGAAERQQTQEKKPPNTHEVTIARSTLVASLIAGRAAQVEGGRDYASGIRPLPGGYSRPTMLAPEIGTPFVDEAGAGCCSPSQVS